MTSQSLSSQRSWVDHPVYVAGVSVAGTIAICIALYKEVLLPAQMAASDYKVSELERQLKDVNGQKLIAEKHIESNKFSYLAEKARLSSDLASIKVELEKTNLELSRLKLGNLFFEGGIYPSSFDKVKVGQSVSAVEKKFEGFSIKKEDGFVTVEVAHPFFGSVVYYYLDDASQTIYQIMYMSKYGADSSVGSDYLQVQLEQAFGEPLKMAEDKFFWKVQSEFNIFKDDENSFVISTGNNRPGGWDRVIDRYWKSIAAQKEASK
ncbi:MULTISPECIES: hypothetical protein [unclassified Pseudomonas]|uniref:hypothetical protein n=1 Tax=unclassified Pseudomonas TaxID=196821 RepID=UPI000CD23AE3|nr:MULTISPECIES: hypothetical protein [unclassified Pseudomonas]POA10715.1 hypothetical protein C1892_30025 [Pseudomonas sp. MPBD7-1]